MAIPVRIVGLTAFREKLRNLANTQATRGNLHARLTDAWNASVEAFIRAAIVRVRVDTGMSGASFLPLATASGRTRALDAIQNHLNSNQKRGRAPGLFEFPTGRLNPNRFRSRGQGARDGKRAFRLTHGTPARPVFVFTFQTVVFQFAFHEPMQQALLAGELAFLGRVSSAFARAARFTVTEYLTGRRVRRIVAGQEELVLFGRGI